MAGHGLIHRQHCAFGMIAVCMAVWFAGCSPTGRSDTAGTMLDDELAVSVVHLHCDESPEQLNRLVQPGTVVVWLNKCADDIRIVFPQRKVTVACLNPVSFTSTDEGIYESKIMQPGSVASLCFIQPGVYVYSVERPGDSNHSQRLEGAVVVK